MCRIQVSMALGGVLHTDSRCVTCTWAIPLGGVLHHDIRYVADSLACGGRALLGPHEAGGVAHEPASQSETPDQGSRREASVAGRASEMTDDKATVCAQPALHCARAIWGEGGQGNCWRSPGLAFCEVGRGEMATSALGRVVVGNSGAGGVRIEPLSPQGCVCEDQGRRSRDLVWRLDGTLLVLLLILTVTVRAQC